MMWFSYWLLVRIIDCAEDDFWNIAFVLLWMILLSEDICFYELPEYLFCGLIGITYSVAEMTPFTCLHLNLSKS